jgi:hypothetical protein
MNHKLMYPINKTPYMSDNMEFIESLAFKSIQNPITSKIRIITAQIKTHCLDFDMKKRLWVIKHTVPAKNTISMRIRQIILVSRNYLFYGNIL